METYEQMRVYITLPPQQRAAMAYQALRAVLATTRPRCQALLAADHAQLQQVFGERGIDLIEIANQAAETVEQVLDGINQTGEDITDEGHMRALRHDLRGPVGTMRGALLMLARRVDDQNDPFAQEAEALIQATNTMRDIIDALLDEEERE